MSQKALQSLDLEQIVSLARQFVKHDMLDEASEFFQIAQRLMPDNLGIKLSLAQVRNRQRTVATRKKRDLGASLMEQNRRDAIDAWHFYGLASLYEERGKRAQAAQCLEIARAKVVINPDVCMLHGKILAAQGRFDEAADSLRRGRHDNPFDREAAETLSRVEYERGRYHDALDAAVDAFWLLRPTDAEGSDRLIRRIRTYRALLKLSREDLVERFRQRREVLQTAFDRLEYHRERLLNEDAGSAADRVAAPPATPDQIGRIELAGRLRQLDVLSGFDDVELFQLAASVRTETAAEGTTLFEQGTQGGDIYILERGLVSIQRETAYGRIVLGAVSDGALLGEINFISRRPRLADAVAAEPSTLLHLDAQTLEHLIRDQPSIGVKIHQAFWHALARKLRQSNEQLSTFFADEPGARRGDASDGTHDTLTIGAEDQVRLLREQGLTATELATLANFSEVKRFTTGTYLFREGDQGEEMYVVLEGRVMISKYIPGGGEEALAILDRGDVFGEMSLLDGEPRSADARAHAGAVTVIAFDETILAEVLSMDPQAALQFLQLLCRLLCRRLREIDEKLTTWRIMAGARQRSELVPSRA